MGVFDRAINTAKKLIAKNGQAVIWRKINAITPDSQMPWKHVGSSSIDYSVRIVFIPSNLVNQELIRYLKNSEVTSGSVNGLMGSVDFQPLTNDFVIRNGVVLRIKSIDELSPNGEKILYAIEFEQ